MTHDIVLHALGRGMFDASWNGETLVAKSDQPILDSCRALRSRGVTGTLRTRHAGSAHFAMTVEIEVGAGLAAVEGKLRGPRIVKYQPFGGLTSEDSGPRMPALLAGVALGQPQNKTGVGA